MCRDGAGCGCPDSFLAAQGRHRHRGLPLSGPESSGRTAGIGGIQSRLVDKVLGLLDGGGWSPTWVLLENVPFMLHLNGGRAMRHVTSRLAQLGYRWAYRTVDTQAFGLPQRRRRVFLLASRMEDPRDVLLTDEGLAPSIRRSGRAAHGFYWTEGNRGLGWAKDAVPTLKGGSGAGIPSPPAVWLPSGRIVTPDIRDAERLQGFPPNWTRAAVEPTGSRHGVGVRWRLVGNAVSVPVAEWLGHSLRRPGRYDPTNDEALESDALWPYSGWGFGDKAFRSAASLWPVSKRQQRLATFLRYEPTELSVRAATGFLARLRKSRLRRDENFVEALVQHVARLSDRDSGHTDGDRSEHVVIELPLRIDEPVPVAAWA